jgi:hypothetical protein
LKKLLGYRSAKFDANEDHTFEVEAILAASCEPIFWQGRDPDLSLRIVPLPFETPVPPGFRVGDAVSERWVGMRSLMIKVVQQRKRDAAFP